MSKQSKALIQDFSLFIMFLNPFQVETFHDTEKKVKSKRVEMTIEKRGKRRKKIETREIL
jgi:hypothetical protein